jgi:predicted aspartyl protease
MRAIAIVMIGLGASAGVHGRGTVTSFDRGGQGGVIVQVRVNGEGPLRFLVDTGSTHSALTATAARRLNAPAVARAVLDSSLGGESVPVVGPARLEIGPVAVTGVMPSVVRDGAFGPGEIDGILGQDVLAPQRYTIDFRARRIEWHGGTASAATSLRSTLVLEPSDGRFVVTVPQRGPALRLVPDSGAATLLLFKDDPDRLPPMRAGGRGELATMTARRDVGLATVGELLFGPIVIRNVPAVLVEPSPRQGAGAARVDGLLPLHLFDRVTFDGVRRLLVLEKQA